MLKDLFKLLVSCVSEPAETISRVGCSCIRSEAKVMIFLEGRMNKYRPHFSLKENLTKSVTYSLAMQ